MTGSLSPKMETLAEDREILQDFPNCIFCDAAFPDLDARIFHTYDKHGAAYKLFKIARMRCEALRLEIQLPEAGEPNAQPSSAAEPQEPVAPTKP